MRFSLVFFNLLLVGILAAAEIKVSPTITEVTVYRSGAKLSSNAVVRIPAGVSEVIFENLSPYFNSNSLQVRIKGSATLVSAVFRAKDPGPSPENPRSLVLQDSLVLLGDEYARINNELGVLLEEQTLLQNSMAKVGTSLNNQTTILSIEDIKKTTEYYRIRVSEIRERQLLLAIKKRQMDKLYQKIQQDLQRLQPNQGNITGEIALKIESPSAQAVDITCIYLISEAGWTPLYDLRSEGFDKPLNLVYKANVSNRSGFDWKKVILHLSSALPLSNNNRPILNPIFVDFRTIAYYQNQQKPGAITYQMAEVQNMATDVARSSARDAGMTLGDDEAPLILDAENTDGADFTQFDLPKPQDILADGQENIVTVEEKEIAALYEYHTVPKLEAAVFLLAKVADYGKYNLLPGQANIFYMETFVGQTYVNPQVTSDTLLLSLGRDEQLTVKRVQPQDLTGRKKVFDKNIRETYTYEITVKNNKSTPVKVNLLDQIPVSKQADIEVKMEDKGGAAYTEMFGKLEWDLEIPAGQNKKIRFTYSVKYPKDKQIGFGKQ